LGERRQHRAERSAGRRDLLKPISAGGYPLRAAWDQEDDVFVLVDFAHATRVAQAILVAAGQDDIQFYQQTGRGCQDVEVELPPDWDPEQAEVEGSELKAKDKTAAERMRRYRNKHRNDERNSVTEEPKLKLVAAE
jgi:hypothetical protein